MKFAACRFIVQASRRLVDCPSFSNRFWQTIQVDMLDQRLQKSSSLISFVSIYEIFFSGLITHKSRKPSSSTPFKPADMPTHRRRTENAVGIELEILKGKAFFGHDGVVQGIQREQRYTHREQRIRARSIPIIGRCRRITRCWSGSFLIELMQIDGFLDALKIDVAKMF